MEELHSLGFLLKIMKNIGRCEMNRKQKKAKRLKATRHKETCFWLKGGMPRRYKKLRGLLITKGIRISRKRLHEISIRTMNAYMELEDNIRSRHIDL